jgi:hypothetical protein
VRCRSNSRDPCSILSDKLLAVSSSLDIVLPGEFDLKDSQRSCHRSLDFLGALQLFKKDIVSLEKPGDGTYRVVFSDSAIDSYSGDYVRFRVNSDEQRSGLELAQKRDETPQRRMRAGQNGVQWGYARI